jgi:hypothetical protein
MTDPIHPARQMPYDDLMAGLERARALGFVHRRASAGGDLHLYVYTPRCVYEDGWDAFTRLARGLIIDEAARRLVATPSSTMAAGGGRPRRATSPRRRPPGPRLGWTPPTSPA